MPGVFIGGTDYYPAQHVYGEKAARLLSGIDVNSVILKTGHAPSTACMILHREAVKDITHPELHILSFSDTNGDEKLYPNFVFTRARSIGGAFDQGRFEAASDGTYPYQESFEDKQFVLAEFEDIRSWFPGVSAADKNYNVIESAEYDDMADTETVDYYTATLNASVTWEWSEVVTDLWDELPGSVTLDVSGFVDPLISGSTETSKPKNLIGKGLDCWEMLCRILEATGHTIAPTATGFAVYKYGASSPLETYLAGGILDNQDVAVVSRVIDTTNTDTDRVIPSFVRVSSPTGLVTQRTPANEVDIPTQYDLDTTDRRYSDQDTASLTLSVSSPATLSTTWDFKSWAPVSPTIPISEWDDYSQELAIRHCERLLTKEDTYEFTGAQSYYPDHKHHTVKVWMRRGLTTTRVLLGPPPLLPESDQQRGSGSSEDHPHGVATSASGATSTDVDVDISSVYTYFGIETPGADPANAANTRFETISAGGDFMIVEGDFTEYDAAAAYTEDDVVTYDNGGGLKRWQRNSTGGPDGAFNPSNWTDVGDATNWKVAYVFNTADVTTYNVKIQEEKERTDSSIQVKWLDNTMVEVGTAFTAYDPHNQFSSGGVTDALGRVTLVRDADDSSTRFEFTHLEGPALFTYGTLSGDASSGTAPSTSYNAFGPKWQNESPSGTITITGLGSETTGASYIATLEDPDANPIEYRSIGATVSGQTYNVKVQESKERVDASVSVKWLDDSLAEFDSAFDAYDPHNEFSTGGLSDVFGRITLVTDADTEVTRWELTHLQGLALVITGTLSEDAGATTSNAASSSSYVGFGPKWQQEDPGGSVLITGLTDEENGDAYVAILEDPDAANPEYRAIKVPDNDHYVEVSSNDTTPGSLESKIQNAGVYNPANHQLVYRETEDEGADESIVLFTDKGGASAAPQTYNVKLQEVKAATDTEVDVKWVDESLTEFDAAFTVYDPHQEYSSGGSATAFGRIALVTDPDDATTRFELTQLQGAALIIYGTLSEDEGNTTSGEASSSSYLALGPKWQNTSPSGAVSIKGLDGELTGDSYIAILEDPDASPLEYRAIKVPEKDKLVRCSSDDTTSGYLEDKIDNVGTYVEANHQLVYRETQNPGADESLRLFTDKVTGGSGDTIGWLVPDGTQIFHDAAFGGDADLYVWDNGTNEFVLSATGQTLYNYTGHVLAPGVGVPAYLVEANTWVALDNSTCTIVTATATTDSNASNAYTSFEVSSVVGRDGEDDIDLSSPTNIVNPLSLEIDTGDVVFLVGDYNGLSGNYAAFAKQKDDPVNFDCLVVSTITAGSWDDVADEWTDGTGTVKLLTYDGSGVYSLGTDVGVWWKPNVEISPPSGKAYRGEGWLIGGEYHLHSVYTCDAVDYTE